MSWPFEGVVGEGSDCAGVKSGVDMVTLLCSRIRNPHGGKLFRYARFTPQCSGAGAIARRVKGVIQSLAAA